LIDRGHAAAQLDEAFIGTHIVRRGIIEGSDVASITWIGISMPGWSSFRRPCIQRNRDEKPPEREGKGR
jgi:hypothetical protein